MNLSVRAKAELTIVVAAFIGGSSYLVSQGILRYLPPFEIAALRALTAAIALYLFDQRGVRTLSSEVIRAGVYLGVALGGGIMLLLWGLQTAPGGVVAFVISADFMLVALLDKLLFRIRISRLMFFAILLAFCGVGLLTVKSDLSVTPEAGILLGAAVSYAFYTVLNSHYAKRYPSTQLTFVSLTTVTILASVVSLVFEGVPVVPPLITWPAILYIGVVVAAIRFTMTTSAQRIVPAAHYALIFLLEPIFAALLGWIFADEIMTSSQLWGAVLIIMAVMCSLRDGR